MDAKLAKKVLEEKKNQLEKQLKESNEFPQIGYSDDDNALEVEQFQESVGLQRNIKGLLKAVNKALKKIDEGTYGMCEVCKEKIESGRIKAFPEAVLCVSHAAEKAKR